MRGKAGTGVQIPQGATGLRSKPPTSFKYPIGIFAYETNGGIFQKVNREKD